MRRFLPLKSCVDVLKEFSTQTHLFDVDCVLEGLSADSRKVVERGAFVAIKGTQADGHQYIASMIKKGVKLIVAEHFAEQEIQAASESGCSLIATSDSRKAYALLSFEWWENPQRVLKVVGITGTNGKTTVASLCWQLLNACGKKADLLGTAGKSIGGVFTASRLTTADPMELAKDFFESRQSGSEIIVMEVSSHALDQQRTVAIDFDVAVFTNLSRDHLDYHGSMQAYAEAKYLLFKNLRPSATAVINADDNYAELMAKTAAQNQLFSFKNLVEANVHARIKEIGSAGMTVEVHDISLQTRLIGRFNAQNLVAAILAAKALGINESNMEGASPGLVPADGRMQFVSIEDSEFLPLVVVDYAHTPDAMENTLAAVHEILEKGKSLSVIFGCGGDRDRGKRPEMAAIAERYAHKIYVTEDNPRTEDSDQIFSDILKGFSSDASYSVICSRKEAIQKAITQASEHEILLILGKGHETYQEIGTTRHHFDDREEARSALRAYLAALKKAGGAF